MHPSIFVITCFFFGTFVIYIHRSLRVNAKFLRCQCNGSKHLMLRALLPGRDSSLGTYTIVKILRNINWFSKKSAMRILLLKTYSLSILHLPYFIPPQFPTKNKYAYELIHPLEIPNAYICDKHQFSYPFVILFCPFCHLTFRVSEYI